MLLIGAFTGILWSFHLHSSGFKAGPEKQWKPHRIFLSTFRRLFRRQKAVCIMSLKALSCMAKESRGNILSEAVLGQVEVLPGGKQSSLETECQQQESVGKSITCMPPPPFSVNSWRTIESAYHWVRQYMEFTSNWKLHHKKAISNLESLPVVPEREEAKRTNLASSTQRRLWFYWSPGALDPTVVGPVKSYQYYWSTAYQDTVHSPYDVLAANNQPQQFPSCLYFILLRECLGAMVVLLKTQALWETSVEGALSVLKVGRQPRQQFHLGLTTTVCHHK